MLKIHYHTNNIPTHSYDNKASDNPAPTEKQKIISCIYNIKNSALKKTVSFYEDRSGTYLKKIKFIPLSDFNTINVTSYIYCSMTNLFPKNNVGIALDNDGNILIIKGKSNNLIKGIYKKYTRGYHYQGALLTNDSDDIKFHHIYVNQQRTLIGKEKKTNKHYAINIDEISSSLDISEQHIVLRLSTYIKKPFDDALILQKKDMSELYFHFKKGKLFLDKIRPSPGENDRFLIGANIHIPLNKNYSIQSIKKIHNHLQIESRKGIKSRIFYLNPENISLKKLNARKISHKPPQNFTSRLGSDPHEKYHSGLPFTSDRKGNFSRYNIPLISSFIDKFHLHLNSAKEHRIQGRNKKAFISVIKSVDPGLGALYITTVNGIKKIRSNILQNSMTDKQIMFTSMQSQTKSFIPIINEVLGNVHHLDFSDAIISLMKKIQIHDSIILQNSNVISGFFGVAAAGAPFNPGWFAGIVVILAKNYNLILSRPDNKNITVTFSYRRKKSIILIGGTGQGLEKTLLNSHTINYMTVMPAEANLIIATHLTKQSDFSFTLSTSDFEIFATQLYRSEHNDAFNQQLINQSILKDRREKELIFMLEAKSELRAQIGTLVNPTTYMVMPRTASGVRLGLNLIELKSVDEKTVIDQKKTHPNNLTAHLWTPEADLFHEEKIMPVAMQQGSELWCYPFPLIEEYRPASILNNKKNITITKEIDKKQLAEFKPSDKCYDRPFSLMEIDKIPLVITVDSSLTINKYRLQKSKLSDKNIASLVEKLGKIKNTFMQQERDSLYKQCKVFLSCYYDNNEFNDGVKIYQLTKIEIRRITTLNHMTATIPLVIISLANNKSLSYDELLGEINFLYHCQESNIPHSIQFDLNLLY